MRAALMMLILVLVAGFIGYAQNKKQPKASGFGLKGGINFAKVTNASSINTSNRSGFHVGGFYSPGSGKQVLGYRSETIYSKQGYDFKSGSTSGTVSLDYIIMPNLMTINITKFVQLQVGGQVAFLLNAKADSSVNGGSSNPYQSVMDYYNRFDYGFAGGIEIHPIAGLLIGARLNISLNDLYEQQPQGMYPAFIPNTSDVNLKNNVFQVFVGYIF